MTKYSDFIDMTDALYRFGAGQDLRDRELLESAFAVDASLDFTHPARRFGVDITVFTKRDTIVSTIMANLSNLNTTHTITNPRILEYSGTRGLLFTLVEAQHFMSNSHNRYLLLKNIYRTELSKGKTDWRITKMIITNVWYSGDPKVLFPDASSE